MANQEHLDILKQGVETWNQWRKEHPKLRPNLSKADLREANLREGLRSHGYVPILFDFDRPSNRNVTETVKTLAHLSRFIIADLTNPSSIPYELAQIVPSLAVPVQPVLLKGKKVFAMFPDLPRTYHWVLPIHYYTDQAHLLSTLQEHVVIPAERKAQELEKR